MQNTSEVLIAWAAAAAVGIYACVKEQDCRSKLDVVERLQVLYREIRGRKK